MWFTWCVIRFDIREVSILMCVFTPFESWFHLDILYLRKFILHRMLHICYESNSYKKVQALFGLVELRLMHIQRGVTFGFHGANHLPRLRLLKNWPNIQRTLCGRHTQHGWVREQHLRFIGTLFTSVHFKRVKVMAPNMAFVGFNFQLSTYSMNLLCDFCSY